MDLWAELNQFGHRPMRRAVTFCAGLALNQGEPATALEIVATTKNQNYTTVRNIKVQYTNSDISIIFVLICNFI